MRSEKRIRLRIPAGKPLALLKRESGRTTLGVRATIRSITDYELEDDAQDPDRGTVGIFESLRAICAWNG